MSKKYTFQSERDTQNNFDCTNIILTVESDSLEEILQAFEDFLLANGFSLHDVHLDLVEDEDN